MSFTVLVVCSANVCRSPLAAALLDRALRGHLVRHQLQIRTCGLDAEPGSSACPVVSRALAHDPEARPTLSTHRASRLAPEMLADADLVLTADRRARAGVVRMLPQAHGRVFTLREAEQLSLQMQEPVADAHPGGQSRHRLPNDTEGLLREFVTQLDAQRGKGDLVRTERRRTLSAPWRPLRIHGHDVPDAHTDRVPHSLVLRLARPAIAHLSEALTTFVASADQGQ